MCVLAVRLLDAHNFIAVISVREAPTKYVYALYRIDYAAASASNYSTYAAKRENCACPQQGGLQCR